MANCWRSASISSCSESRLRKTWASVARIGRNQAIRIPREFELDGEEVIMRKEGNRLIVEPLKKSALLEVLSNLDAIEESFPNVDDGLVDLDDIDLMS